MPRALATAVAGAGAAALLIPLVATAAPVSVGAEDPERAPTGAGSDDAPLEPTAVDAPEALAGPQPGPSSVDLELLATYDSGEFGVSAAEIVEYDPVADRLYVVNALAGGLDVLDVSGVDGGDLPKVGDLSAVGVQDADGETIPEGAVVNSVRVLPGGRVAAAVEHPEKTEPGWVAIWSTADGVDPEPWAAVRVGPLPDMVTSSDPTGGDCVRTCVLAVANEGEPAEDFSSDPEGSIAVITIEDMSVPPTQEDVRTARFTAYDEGAPLPEGVRVFGPDVPVPDGQEPAGRVARNLEPEYITVDPDGRTAYVAVQEANAIATVDLVDAQVTDLWAIPLKDWAAEGTGFDASNRDDAIAMNDWPVYGMAMPDGINTFTAGGQTYIVTANEGDAREWGEYVEGVRLAEDTYPLCADAFGGEAGVAELKDEAALGRLNVSTEDGLREGEDCYERIHAYGSRGMSILTTDGEEVFESGSLLEGTIAELIEAGELPENAWNANHEENPSFDNRSDDKGPEPEYVEIAAVGARVYAFLGLERIGGVMTLDVTDPQDVRVVGYDNNRDWEAEYEGEPPASGSAGDLGPEGLAFFHRLDAPDDRGYLAVGNEVSGTTSVFRVDDRSFDQIGGTDRWDTAAVVSQVVEATGFRYPDAGAVVATGQDWADALTAGPGAAASGAPLLLTKQDAVPAATTRELTRLALDDLLVVGGPSAVEAEVVEELAGLAGTTEQRFGANRYETAVLLAPESPDRVFLATGGDYPDALSAGSAAAAGGDAVLLTRPDRLPGVVADYLAELGPDAVTVLGGSDAVSPAVIEQVRRYTPQVELIDGDDRYDTAALLSERLDPGVRTVYVTTGEDYPDALTSTALTRTYGNPVLLTRPDRLPAATADEITRLQPDRIVVVGGDTAVDARVREDLAALLP